jgi:hypothetical protein
MYLSRHNAAPERVSGAPRAFHMPPSAISQIAVSAAVNRFVLSHRMLRALVRKEETRHLIGASYSGPVALANDLDSVSLRGKGAPAPSRSPWSVRGRQSSLRSDVRAGSVAAEP